jgi:hypothetical protein
MADVMTEMNSQEGGMKIIVKNDKGEDMSIRRVRDMQEFINIFSKTIQVHNVSVNSLTGFIVRITLPIESTPFRSDIFNERGELMNADEYHLPNTGRYVTQHILKCCIIQPNKIPLIAKYSGTVKSTCTYNEFLTEYTDQSNIYNATMAYGGMPVCPDVYALATFNLAQFSEIFFPGIPSPTHASVLPAIGTNVFKDNTVFRYLLEQLEYTPIRGQPPVNRKVGIILMESLPPSYEPLKNLYNSFSSSSTLALTTNPVIVEKKRLFDEMTERVLAICVVVFYRIGYIPLDAHLGNWMYDTTQPFDQFKVRAIDFGRVMPHNNPFDLDNIRNLLRTYVRMYTNPAEKVLIIAGVARLLKIPPSTVDSAEMCGTKLGEIMIALNKLIRRNQNGSILWNPTGTRFSVITQPATADSPEQRMEVDSCMILIHRIIFIIALVDSCYNTQMFKNHHFCKLRDLFSPVFGKKCNNVGSMIGDNVYIDLVSYLKAMPDHSERIRTIGCYRRIRDYIGNYLRISPQRGMFPDPFYQDPSPDTPEDPAVVAARIAALPPPPIPPPPPPRKSPSKSSPRKLSPKKTQVSPLESSPTAEQYERLVSGYSSSHPPPPPLPLPGGGNKKLIKLRKSRNLRKSRKPIKTKLSKILKTKKNKNHNRYRRNKRYRL